MCDTFVIVKDNKVLFGKNSDRDPNELQLLDWVPRKSHEPNTSVKCTYISIPQVNETFAVLLSRPFWMWGAEMGSNEFGVTIGNEAVFTKEKVNKVGLTGMDLLRLALERSKTAKQALGVIIELLDIHGQGGGCGFENRNFTYHNSFIIADSEEAYVLETAGKKYEVESVSGERSISNGLTISPFREQYSDYIKTTVSAAKKRQCFIQKELVGRSDLASLMGVLRRHNNPQDGEVDQLPNFSWINGAMAAPCMHAGGVLAASQTTASWVADLTAGNHWATSTATPCLSLFKPVSVLKPLTDPEMSSQLWLKHEEFHRIANLDPKIAHQIIDKERNNLESEWLKAPPSTEVAFEIHLDSLDKWLEKIKKASITDKRPAYLRRYWNKRADYKIGIDLA